MADDWRIRIEVEEEEHARGLLDRLGAELSGEARELARELEQHRLASFDAPVAMRAGRRDRGDDFAGPGDRDLSIVERGRSGLRGGLDEERAGEQD